MPEYGSDWCGWQCSYGDYLNTCWDCTFTQSAVHEPAWLECTCDTNDGISTRTPKNLSKMAPMAHSPPPRGVPSLLQVIILLLLTARYNVQDSTVNRNDLSVDIAVPCEIEKSHAHLLISAPPLCRNMSFLLDLLCGQLALLPVVRALGSHFRREVTYWNQKLRTSSWSIAHETTNLVQSSLL